MLGTSMLCYKHRRIRASAAPAASWAWGPLRNTGGLGRIKPRSKLTGAEVRYFVVSSSVKAGRYHEAFSSFLAEMSAFAALRSGAKKHVKLV